MEFLDLVLVECIFPLDWLLFASFFRLFAAPFVEFSLIHVCLEFDTEEICFYRMNMLLLIAASMIFQEAS